jgi:hemerythrin-like metal-binding protein
MLPMALIILMTGVAAGSIGYFNASQSVDELAGQIRRERSRAIVSHLEHFLSAPQQVLAQNARLIETGVIDASDLQTLQRIFLEQSITFDGGNSIYFGNTDGGIAVGGHEGDARDLYVIETDDFKAGTFTKTWVDASGRRGAVALVLPDYDARTRNWYKAAALTSDGVWGDPFVLFTGLDIAMIPSLSVRTEEGELIGVLGSNISLIALSDFLRSLYVDGTGHAFIIDDIGTLIAHSGDGLPFRTARDGAPAGRLMAVDSDDPVLAGAARAIGNLWDGRFHPDAPESLTLDLPGGEMVADILPYNDAYGLRWSVVKLTPPDAFRQPFEHSIWFWIGLTIASVFGLVLLAGLIARRILGPISEVSRKAHALAAGDFDQSVNVVRNDEIGQLGSSFNRMAVQLKELFETQQRSRAHVEDALAKADHNHRLAILAIKSSRAGTMHFNIVQDDLDWDARSMEIFGVTPANFGFCYAAWVALVHPEDRDRINRSAKEQLESAKSLELRYRIVRPDGVIRHVLAVASIIRDDDGKAVAVSGMHFDETDSVEQSLALKKALAEAEEATTAKSHFLAGMSHELRTPLNAVIGFSQLLKLVPGSSLDERQEDYVDSILLAANHLLSLVNDVLDLSRIEANEISVRIEEVDAVGTVRDCIAQIASLAADRNVSVENRLEGELPVPVRTDPVKFRQALINLLSNAVKYNRDGGKVVVNGQERSSGYYRVSVADTGIGISEESQGRVFQLFQRLDRDSHIAREGTGLGLAVTKMLVESLGGRIGFESEEGVGSTFWIDIPDSANDEVLIWSDDLRVGVEAIDKDHQVIFALANAIIFEDSGIPQLDRTISELIEYTDYHFRREERIMEISGYPKLDAHRKFHRDLISKVNEVADEWREKQDPETLHVLRRLLQRWWIGHIVNVDYEIAHYAGDKKNEIRAALHEMG